MRHLSHMSLGLLEITVVYCRLEELTHNYGVRMKIPVVQQYDSSDCGVACVVSISEYYGKTVTISQLRGVMGTDATGTSIKGLELGLDSIGFTSKAVYVSKE